MNQLLRLSVSGLTEVQPSLSIQLAVADSLLVEDGRARSLEHHFARFESGVAKTFPSELELLPRLFDLFRQLVPLAGRQFPRLELHGEQPAGGRLHLHLRPAPAPLGPATLWTFPDADPRLDPTVKGPDLALGAELRNKAQLLGADEAVIIDDSGYLVEGALSAIVWWRGDTLCAPNDEVNWLDSVTRREVFAIAEQMGLQTRVEHVKPADLVECEVWMLSSLQAIRPVIDWLNLGGPVAKPTRVEAFERRLRLLAEPIR